MLAAGVALSPGGVQAQTAKPVTVTASVINVTVSIWPALVAKKKGYFKDEGLKVNLVTSGKSSRSVQQVAAGAAEIGSSSMVDTVRAIDSGAKVKVFLNSLAVGVHSLVAGKNIKSIHDLKGKRVMTGGQTDITTLWWMAMARKNGMNPTKDVQLLFSGSTANRMAALLAGGVQAAVLSPPQSFKAVEAGYTDLGPIAPYLGPFPMMIWHVSDAWAKNHGKLLIAFARAHDKAVRYMSKPAHREEVSKMLAEASHSRLKDALKSWDLCMKVNAFVPNGEVTDATVKRVINVLKTTSGLKPKPIATYYDGEYAAAAAK
jgi:NitT/TauT family transport system substrate-binding protein